MLSELELHPSTGSNIIEGFFDQSGKALMMPESAAAVFVTDGQKMKMVLRNKATIYELFHELMHLKHAKSIGLKKYYTMGGKYSPGELIKETWVFEKIIEHKGFFTQSELIDALKYINKVRKENGLGPIIMSFDDIPKVRKEIDLIQIFNLK